MFGQMTDLPFLCTYEDALEHYKSIKPIRGSWPEVRPICKTANGRRKKHMEILTTKVNGVNVVACRLYDTDVVTFWETGEGLFYTNGYATNSTHDFADKILSPGWQGSIDIRTRDGKTEVTVAGNEAVRLDGSVPLQLRWDKEEQKWEFANKPKQYGYYLRRGVMGMRRKEVEPFTKYCVGLAKLIDNSTWTEMARFRNAPQWATDETKHKMKQHEALFAEMDAITSVEVLHTRMWAGREGWAAAAHFIIHQAPTTPATVRKKIDAVLKYVHFETLFEARETFKPARNKNEKYEECNNHKLKNL